MYAGRSVHTEPSRAQRHALNVVLPQSGGHSLQHEVTFSWNCGSGNSVSAELPCSDHCVDYYKHVFPAQQEDALWMGYERNSIVPWGLHVGLHGSTRSAFIH